MYFPYWMILLVVSLWASILAFVWALRTGQFADQGRARYLPLRDLEPLAPDREPSKITLEIYALTAVAGIALLGLLAAALLTVLTLKG